jgi:hypothetical protein
LDEADRETVIRNFLSGQYGNALRVIAFNAAEGWSQDVSEDVAHEVLDRTYDADDTLSEATKRFIDRHVTPGREAATGTVGKARAGSGSSQEGVGRVDIGDNPLPTPRASHAPCG